MVNKDEYKYFVELHLSNQIKKVKSLYNRTVGKTSSRIFGRDRMLNIWKTMQLRQAFTTVDQWLKWFCEAGGSPDEARLEQTPIYPFQPH